MEDYEKRRRALRETREIIAETCRSAGCPGLGDAFDMDYINSIGGCVVEIKRQGTASEAPATISRYSQLYTLQGSSDDEGRREIRHEALRLCRAHLRSQAIGGHPGGVEPTWAHEIHPLILSILRYFGVRDEDTCGVNGSYAMRTSLLNSVKADPRDGSRIDMLGFINSAGRISGRVRLYAADGMRIEVDTAKGAATITVPEATLPATAQAMIDGEPVERLIGHPAFCGTGVLLGEQIDSSSNDLVIQMDRTWVPVCDAPEGADLKWMTLTG